MWAAWPENTSQLMPSTEFMLPANVTPMHKIGIENTLTNPFECYIAIFDSDHFKDAVT